MDDIEGKLREPGSQSGGTVGSGGRNSVKHRGLAGIQARRAELPQSGDGSWGIDLVLELAHLSAAGKLWWRGVGERLASNFSAITSMPSASPILTFPNALAEENRAIIAMKMMVKHDMVV